MTVDSVLNIKGFDLTRTLEMDPEFLDTDAEHIHDKTIGSMSINVDGDVHMMLINSFIGGILQTLGNDIYRMKGVLAISGSPEKFVYQGVHMLFDGEFHGNWEEGEKRCSKLVFIGKNLDKDKLQKDFEKCLNVPANNERIAAIESIKLQERIGGQLLGAAQRDDSRAVTSLIAMGADVNFGNVVRGTGCVLVVQMFCDDVCLSETLFHFSFFPSFPSFALSCCWLCLNVCCFAFCIVSGIVMHRLAKPRCTLLAFGATPVPSELSLAVVPTSIKRTTPKWESRRPCTCWQTESTIRTTVGFVAN